MQVTTGPKVSSLMGAILAKYPKYENFLNRRFENLSAIEVEANEKLAEQILKLIGDDLDSFVDGYEFICQVVNDVELHFRRYKEYRLKTFQEAYEQIYSNPDYMPPYMRGLLVTQLFWSNHTRSMFYHTDRLLAVLPKDADLLEIGPGHGLYFARAVQALGPGRVTGWDVSETSLSHTREALAALGVTEGFALQQRDLFAPHAGVASDSAEQRFDAVVFSEVLEHLDDPNGALGAIRNLIRPGGRLFLNVPINSPAPDHIFLLRSPEEAFDLVKSQGYHIMETACFPATNYSLSKAIKHDLTISVCVIATPA